MRLKTKHLHLLLIIILSFALYFNTFFNPFIYDDQFFIVDNFEIRSLKNIPSYFLEPSVGNLYRPLRTVLYSVTFFIWGFNPVGYHLNSVLLHTLISVLVYLIVIEIVGDKRFSFIVSLLFLTHPIHTERVANMTAGFDLLGILFLFWAFYNYVIFRRYNNKKSFVYSIILFILGLFSSEEALVFPLLALLYDFCFIEKRGILNINNIKSKVKYFGIYVFCLLSYLVIRFSTLRQIGRADVYFMGDLQTRILSTMIIFLRYIYVLVFPLNLTVDYYIAVYKSLFSLKIILAIVIYILIFFFWVKLYRNHKIAFFSIGWFFIALLPFSNFFPVFAFMADRYLYVASFGFLLLISYLIHRLSKLSKNAYKIGMVLVIIILVIFYSLVTVVRNTEWRSDYALISKAVEKQPKSSTAHNDLGRVYQENGDYNKEAILEYKEAIRLNDKNHAAWLNLGSLYGEIGNYSAAIYYIDKSLSIYESYKAYNNLGLIYNSVGEHEKAIEELEKAIEFNPSLTKAHMDLGVVYAEIGRFDMALEEFNKALEINPEIADIHYNLGVLYEFLNQTANAKKEFFLAYNLEPNNKLFKDKHLQ